MGDQSDKNEKEVVGEVNTGEYNARLAQSPSETAKFADLYPERKGSRKVYTKYEYMKGKARSEQYKERCGINVTKCLEYSPLVKLMLGALKSQGCITDMFERHFSCDICKEGTEFHNQGGYDDSANQVFVCANNFGKSYGVVHGTILRNLITMFDVCTRKVDFNNVNHLACIEIRKANLAGCNFMIHFTRNNPLAVKEQHASCVANSAITVLNSKIDNYELAKKSVNNVFSKCYNDLEPIGRRCKDDVDMKRAYKERYLFGYE